MQALVQQQNLYKIPILIQIDFLDVELKVSKPEKW